MKRILLALVMALSACSVTAPPKFGVAQRMQGGTEPVAVLAYFVKPEAAFHRDLILAEDRKQSSFDGVWQSTAESTAALVRGMRSAGFNASSVLDAAEAGEADKLVGALRVQAGPASAPTSVTAAAPELAARLRGKGISRVLRVPMLEVNAHCRYAKCYLTTYMTLSLEDLATGIVLVTGDAAMQSQHEDSGNFKKDMEANGAALLRSSVLGSIEQFGVKGLPQYR